MGLLTTDFSYFDQNNHIDFYAVTHPALSVGGDFYDFFMDNGHLCFVIGDVSGKGISGAIMMGVALSLFRSIAHQNATPSYIANYLNQGLSEYNEAEMFVSIFIGKVNLQNGLMTYSNAGHPNPIHMNADRGISFIKLQSEFPLGINAFYSYKEYEYQLGKNNCLLFYTDGVTDSQNCQKEFFSEERLEMVVEKHKLLTPKGLLDEIVKQIYGYKGKCEQTDDFTLLALTLKDFTN
jgi:sigma-B regulation protein RsbU (phosphoserine phosphatase)